MTSFETISVIFASVSVMFNIIQYLNNRAKQAFIEEQKHRNDELLSKIDKIGEDFGQFKKEYNEKHSRAISFDAVSSVEMRQIKESIEEIKSGQTAQWNKLDDIKDRLYKEIELKFNQHNNLYKEAQDKIAELNKIINQRGQQ